MQLLIDDYVDTGADSYTIGSGTFTKSGFGTLSYTGVRQLIVRAGQDQNAIAISSTSSVIPLTVDGTNGTDTITVGSTSFGVKWIQGTVTLTNGGNYNNVVINDGPDSVVDTVVVDDIVTDAWYGRVTGLAPAAILWKAVDTQSVQIVTGNSGDTVSVRSTVKPTTISSGGGSDAVTVGDGGSVARIYFDLTVLNPPNRSNLIVDNSSGIYQQTITLETVSVDGSPFGRIQGFASANILYKYNDVLTLAMTTGRYEDIVNILAIGVPTSINSGGGLDSLTVGAPGRGVQDIASQLTVENNAYYTALTLDDTGDGATARSASMSAAPTPTSPGWRRQ